MSLHKPSVPTPRVLLDGLAYVESPRWHEGRLWFAHWGTGEIVAVDPEGRIEVVAHGPAGLGWSIDWLPDRRQTPARTLVLPTLRKAPACGCKKVAQCCSG